MMKGLNTILRKNRGKGYVQRVDQLSCADDNTLVAWVTGSGRYATLVRIGDEGDFEEFCSCPYNWGPCKHAVAVILAAAEQIKEKKAIPLIDKDDDLRDALYGDSEEEEDWIEDEWEDSNTVPASTPRQTKAQAQVAKTLAEKSRDELLDLLTDLSGRFPEVRRHIVVTEQLIGGQVDKLVRTLRSEIQELAAEPVWYNPWKGEGNLPDYTHLEEQLQALADRGHADAVLQLGSELWTRGTAQVEQSDDEGETAISIAACLDIVMAALPRSSLSPPEQLLWVIDRSLEDEFSLLASADKLLKRRTYSEAHWRIVAETLENRLESLKKPRTTSFSDRYRREKLLNRLLDAYGPAGWKDRIIPRLEAEVDACLCYTQLVDALLTAGEQKRARHWCIQGYTRTAGDSPGIAGALQERLRTMAEKERHHDLVAAYRAQNFFNDPSNKTYTELKRAAEKAKCWPTVRTAALQYLETGQSPVSNGQKSKTRAWPLPSPEVEPPSNKQRNGFQRFPDLPTLIDIAITEKRLDDVVDLYQRLRKTQRWGRGTDETVAKAVAHTHPDLSLNIWRNIVDSLIAEVKPKSYEEAAVYLRLMEKTYKRNHRHSEWLSLLEELRRTHKAKRRLIGVIDILVKKKLVD